MGADGHIVIARREDWNRACPKVAPHELSLYTGTILGVEAVWGYWGDNLYGANYLSRIYEHASGDESWAKDASPELLAAIQWFDANAETHEVWT